VIKRAFAVWRLTSRSAVLSAAAACVDECGSDGDGSGRRDSGYARRCLGVNSDRLRHAVNTKSPPSDDDPLSGSADGIAACYSGPLRVDECRRVCVSSCRGRGG